MKPVEVRKAVRDGTTGPLYLLEGDDLQSRHDLALEFASLVDEGLQAFNVESFYANEAAAASARDSMIGAILATARTLPMMAPRRVILVHEAERLLSPKKSKEDEAEAQPELPVGGKRKRAPTPAEELEAYFEKPEPMTTLVFVAEKAKLEDNRRLVKLLRKHGVSVQCGTIESEKEAAAWIQTRLEKDELRIEPAASARLIKSVGKVQDRISLGRLRAEVEKLVLYCAGESAITEKHVRELVEPQEEAGETFALADAIRDADAAEALREITARIDAGAPPFLLLGLVRLAAGRLRPDAKAKAGLDAVFQTDQAMKSSAGDARHLLECLVVSLCAR